MSGLPWPDGYFRSRRGGREAWHLKETDMECRIINHHYIIDVFVLIGIGGMCVMTGPLYQRFQSLWPGCV